MPPSPPDAHGADWSRGDDDPAADRGGRRAGRRTPEPGRGDLDAQHPTGRYPTGEYPTGRYPSGEHPMGQYPSGEYPRAPHGEDEYRGGPYPDGQPSGAARRRARPAPLDVADLELDFRPPRRPGVDPPVGGRAAVRSGESDLRAHAEPDLRAHGEPNLPVGREPEPPVDRVPESPAGPKPLPLSPERPLLSLGLGGLSALLALAMVVGAQLAHQSYALVVFGVQVLFVVVWTVASQPPAPRVVAFVGLLVAGGADAAAVLVNPATLAPLAYLTAAGFVVGVLGQLIRPAGRVRVTESLGSSLVVVLGVVAYATLIVLSRYPLGTQVIVACVVGAGTALVVAHLTDSLAPIPRLTPPVPRGGIGIVVGAMVGTAASGLAGNYLDGLNTLPTAIAGLAAAVIALMVDMSANYAEASRRLAGAAPAWWLVRHMQGPLTAFALAAPTAYAASLLLARGL